MGGLSRAGRNKLTLIASSNIASLGSVHLGDDADQGLATLADAFFGVHGRQVPDRKSPRQHHGRRLILT